MAIDFQRFFDCTSELHAFHADLSAALHAEYTAKPHGTDSHWDETLAQLPRFDSPNFKLTNYDLGSDRIRIGVPDGVDIDRDRTKHLLRNFMPWRKGPWEVLGIAIDTEWHSDWKWHRICPHISPLNDRRVLDIGTGNGYFLYRMLALGASLALGIDPTRLFLYQFQALQNLLPANNAHLLPLRSEHLPRFELFDTVFSLGVLYHQRSPLDHLTELLNFARTGGELVIETLVVPGNEDTILVPQDRYAKMANVWFLPSTGALHNLLHRAGYVNIRLVDVNQTSVKEQRATEWMGFQSLQDFLDPADSQLTVEGYPAPRRAVFIANKA